MPSSRSFFPLALLGALAGAVTAAPAPLRAQADSVTVTPGPHYAASGLRAWLLGREYRDLWTTPIRVPVLDLRTFGGGLTPVRRGGGKQTVSLRFRAPDGRQYNFRSVDKNQGGGLHPDFRGTLIDRVAQDQVSSKHPASAMITDPLLQAAGVLHPRPQLYVMPDDPRLGEFRADFAGMLGMMEIHPDEGEDDEPLFAGAARVAGTERLLEHLESSPEHRVASREFLKARLMDFLVGDWDRHVGQWRWARYDRDGVHTWVAVPEDRDNAFSHFDGLLLDMARPAATGLTRFREEYPPVFRLTENAQILDRRLLSELPRQAYDSIAADLRARLTDEVIVAAVANTPPEHQALRGIQLIRKLQARRETLPEIAREFYAQLAREVEVRATDEPDLATVDRLPDGSVEVRLFGGTEENERDRYFFRRFLPGETREVRVHLHGGDDRAVVRGDARESLLVRVIGGGGDDVLVDSSRVAGRARTALYDHRGEDRLVGTARTIVDTRPFSPPERPETGFNENRPDFRDWGRDLSWFVPAATWRYNMGPVIGGGPRIVRYGFRRVPYAHRVDLRGLYAPLETRFGIELDGDFRRTNSFSRTTLRAFATQLEVTRFHGFGNETPAAGSSSRYKIFETQVGAEALYHHGLSRGSEFFAGPVIRFRRPEPEPGGPADVERPFGTESYAQVGGLAGWATDTRDLRSFPKRGVRAVLSGSGFTAPDEAWDQFGAIDGFAAGYLPLPRPWEGTLALRAGGRAALGDFPIQEAAYVGGSETLRGFPRQRFAGDAAVFAGAEMRSFLTRFKFISRGDLGLISTVDAGRVFAEGEASSRWHTGVGAGVWVGILDRTRTFSAVVARGEETVVYLTLGMPF